MLCWSRRVGKTLLAWTLLIREALRKPGMYWYCFNNYSTARDSVWMAQTSEGIRFLDMIPKEFVLRINSSELEIELTNGSVIKLVGIEHVDRKMGAGLQGIVFDEYATLDPDNINLITPTLAQTGGWQLLISTPRGKNHFYKKYQLAKKHPEFMYANNLHCGMPEIAQYMAPGFLEQERVSIIDQYGNDALFQQEYLTSWITPNSGSVFGDLLGIMKREGRVAPIAQAEEDVCYTAWDLGNADHTAIVYFRVNEQGGIDVLDTIEARNETVDYYIEEIEARNWQVTTHFLPHDGAYHKGPKNQSYLEVMNREHNLLNVAVLKKPNTVRNKLDYLRRLFSRSRINEACTRALECLEKLEYEWNSKNKVWSSTPTHKGGYSDMCLDGDSMILMADGTRKALKNIVLGEKISVGGEVYTSLGAYPTGVKQTYEVFLPDKEKLIVTGNHKVLTQRGFVRVDNLKPCDTLCHNDNLWGKTILKTRDQIQLFIVAIHTILGNEVIADIIIENIAGKRFICTKSRSHAKMDFIVFVKTMICLILMKTIGFIFHVFNIKRRIIGSCQVDIILKQKADYYIEKFGVVKKEKSQKDITFTIKMAIQRIIALAILNALVHTSIKSESGEKKEASNLGHHEKTLKKRRSKRPCGISLSRGVHGIVDMLKTLCLRIEHTRPVHALSVIAHLKQKQQEADVHADRIVGLNFIVVKKQEQRLVWNMTVEHAHMFNANGVTVSNCDALCYSAQAVSQFKLSYNKAFLLRGNSSATALTPEQAKDAFLKDFLEGMFSDKNKKSKKDNNSVFNRLL